MKTSFLFALLCFCVHGFSQDRWTVQLNSLQLLSVNTEDTAANVVQAKNLKKGSLLVTFVPARAEGERKRRMTVVDANDNELYSKETHNLVLPVATLKKWRLTTPRVKVYTLPDLGAAGANVRLRPVHLCTINFD